MSWISLKAHAALFIVAASLAPYSQAEDKFAETIETFKGAGEPAAYFDKAYGYAVFPTIAKAGLGVGGSRGKGRVFEQGDGIGNTTMTKISIGFQAGGQAFSQVIFFEDERALNEFTSGNFEFGAEANAVALTASASATAGTTGSSAGVAGGRHDASTADLSGWYKGMAIFTIAKGGLMYEASIGGQKFSYEAD